MACGASEPAGQGEDVLGKFGRVQYLGLGPDDGHVDREHVGGFGAGVQDAGVFAVGFDVADGVREAFGGCLGRDVQRWRRLGRVGTVSGLEAISQKPVRARSRCGTQTPPCGRGRPQRARSRLWR